MYLTVVAYGDIDVSDLRFKTTAARYILFLIGATVLLSVSYVFITSSL